MTTLPTRAAIDKAQPLDFPEREKQANISLQAGPMGLTVTIEWTGPVSGIPAAIERLRSAGVLELVSGARVSHGVHSPTATTPARKPAQRVEPVYDGSGQAICPIHRKALSDGRYGPFCSAKAQPGDVQNDKGYCALKFD